MQEDAMSSGFLRVNAVADRYDVAASTIWRWANEKRFAYLNFPKPVPIGPNTTAWTVEELDAHDAARVAERDAPQAVGA